MSNTNASNSANTSITSDTLSNEHSPVWSIPWEGENTFTAPSKPSGWDIQQLQYSWRRKATPNTPNVSPFKEDISLEDLLRKKSYILQNIAQHYSRLVGLMQEELSLLVNHIYVRLVSLKDITGVEPEGYAESMRFYSKAVDDYECFQIFTDSLVVTVSQEVEVNTDSEKCTSHRETSYTLSPGILRKLTYGSLQNVMGEREKKCNCSTEAMDLTDEDVTTSRNRASSAPREAISTTSSHSVTVSSAPTTVQQSQSATLVTLQKAIAPKAVLSRPLLRRFISLKSLSDSLPVLSTGVPLEATRRSAGGNDSRGTGTHNSRGVEQLPPPMQTRRSLSRPDPMKLNDLIAWKNVEIATVQNILRVNMARAMDTALCRKSRKAYRDSVQENQKTLLRLYHESEELKAARQSVLASRSFSVGRIESPLSRLSHPLHISLTLSPAQLPHPDDSLHRTQQFNGGVTTDSSGYHADEQSSDSSHSSTNQAHGASLAISCHSSGPASTFNSVPSHRKEILSPLLCSKHSSNDVRRASSDVHYQGLHETTRVTKLPTNYVQYLFPDQTVQAPMRSYGRPNYSRHRTTVVTQNRGADLNKLQRLYYDESYDQISSHHSSQTPLVKPQNSLFQRTDSATPNHIFPPSTFSPSAYFNKSPCDVKLMSELERLTSPLSRQFAPSEATPTSTTRTRFTLADKLNMSTTYFH